MDWTKEIPKSNGHYWVRHSDYRKEPLTEIAQIDTEEEIYPVKLVGSDWPYEYSEIKDWEWWPTSLEEMTSDTVISLKKAIARREVEKKIKNEEFQESFRTPIESFFYKIRDWQDWDYVEHELGRMLGIFDGTENYATDIKWIFWTDNTIGNALYEILLNFEKLGLVEFDQESKFRSVDKFKEILEEEMKK